MTTAIDIAPLSPVVGAEVSGIDLRRPIEADTADALRAAFVDRSVLCVRDQKVSASDQIRFASLFGEVDGAFRPPSTELGTTNQQRGVMLVTNIRRNGRQIGSLPDGEMQFHSDGSHRARPYRATSLFAIRIPSVGGDTLFAGLAAAYDALPEATRARIDGLEAEHAYAYDLVSRDRIERSVAELSRARHPLVRVHPDSGRKALYLSRLMTQAIVGMDRAESDALLAELFDHIERPEFVYAHRWRLGDLVIWDNRSVNHARTDFPADEDRLLRRYTVSEPE